MDEVPSDSHSRSSLFGFWKRHRARQLQKTIDELSNQDLGQDDQDAKDERVNDLRVAEFEMRSRQIGRW